MSDRITYLSTGMAAQPEPTSSAEYAARAERPGFSVRSTAGYDPMYCALPSWREALAERLS